MATFLSVFLYLYSPLINGEIRYCGAGQCVSTTVTCDPINIEEKCTIICDGNNACDSSLLLCSAERACELICKGGSGDDPCSGITINAWTASSLVVNASCDIGNGHEDTDCIHANGNEGTYLLCPNGGDCNIFCYEGTACGAYHENNDEKTQFLIVNATYSSSLVVEAIGPDSAGSMQVHCPTQSVGSCEIVANGDASPFPPMTAMDIFADNYVDVVVTCTGSGPCFADPPPVMHCNAGDCGIESCSSICPSTQYPTAVPTTNNPSTSAPTTAFPTTVDPTTSNPTFPTTADPTTSIPTTLPTIANTYSPSSATTDVNDGEVSSISTMFGNSNDYLETSVQSNESLAVIMSILGSLVCCCLVVSIVWYGKKWKNKEKRETNEGTQPIQMEPIKSVSIIPESPHSTNVETAELDGDIETNLSLKNWLNGIGLTEYYYDLFVEQGFVGTHLSAVAKLTDEDLREMGVANASHRQVILSNADDCVEAEQFDTMYQKGNTSTIY